jgi:hypothetical protein
VLVVTHDHRGIDLGRRERIGHGRDRLGAGRGAPLALRYRALLGELLGLAQRHQGRKVIGSALERVVRFLSVKRDP